MWSGNESQRREYLQAVGIVQYVPRWILPGAKPSASIAPAIEEESESSSDAMPPLELAAPSVEAVAPAIPQVLDTVVTGLVASLSPTRKSSVVREEIPTPVASETVSPFSLCIWRPSPALMVLDARSSGEALPTQALLQNILRAKGINDFNASPDVLRWPPLAGQATGTWAAVQEMTLAFLQARLELQPAPYLWLMGENAYKAVVAGGKPMAEALGQAVNLETMGALALVLPSLSDMLRQPQLKAVTWSAIRPHHVC